MEQPNKKSLSSLHSDGLGATPLKQSSTKDAIPPKSHPNVQPTDSQAYTQKADYPVSDHPNPTQGSDQGSTGYQQQKSTVSTMNEEIHNRKHIVITDQNIGETEAVQKIAKAKKAADAAIQAERERHTSP